jgi:hypothetical protein
MFFTTDQTLGGRSRPRRWPWLALAQLRATARRTDSALTPLLIESTDIPGTSWRQIDQRHWRSRRLPHGAGARGARVTVWRSFAQDDERWLWVQLVPFGDPAACRAALETCWEYLVTNRSARGLAAQRHALPAPDGHTRCLEEVTYRTGVRAGENLYVATTRDNILVIVSASSTGDAWTLPDVLTVTDVQRARLITAADPVDESRSSPR